MSHRRLAVSPTPYDIGIERQKNNPMLKTHKIALDPNNVQATQFAQHCGYARVAYNHALADFKQGLTAGDWRSHIDLCRRFNAIKHEQYDWCGEMLQNASNPVVGRRIKFPKLVGSVYVNPYASTAQSVRWLYPRLHIVGSLLSL